jgi:hypothetical protein
MQLTADRIMTQDGHNLPLQRVLRDSLATYARMTWPRDTAKHAARAWKLPKTTAANILKGHASAATITHVLRVGGWNVALIVVGAVVGQGLETFIQQERERLRHDRERQEFQDARLAQMARNLGAVLPLAPGSRMGGAGERSEVARPAPRRMGGRSDG